MAERPLIGRGLLLANGRAANYQRVCTSQAMDTLTEYTCLGISPAIPRVGGNPDHVSSQGKEAIFVTHDIYTIVAEIDDGMDLVFCFKNMTETEGRLNTRTGEYDFIGRSIPVYPQNDLDVSVGKQVLIKIQAPFGEKLSGRIMTKSFGSEKVFTTKLKIENNQGCVQFLNKGQDIVKLRNDKAIGILDLTISKSIIKR